MKQRPSMRFDPGFERTLPLPAEISRQQAFGAYDLVRDQRLI